MCCIQNYFLTPSFDFQLLEFNNNNFQYKGNYEGFYLSRSDLPPLPIRRSLSWVDTSILMRRPLIVYKQTKLAYNLEVDTIGPFRPVDDSQGFFWFLILNKKNASAQNNRREIKKGVFRAAGLSCVFYCVDISKSYPLGQQLLSLNFARPDVYKG